MLLTIHDANLKKVAFIDNDKQETLNYYDDTWTRSLETGSSTFEFTVYKKAIKSDTAINKTYNLLNERAFVSFRHNGKSYVFNVMTVEENEQTIKCYCENLNLELINEYANPYKATKAMSFVEYCNAMDLLNFTHLSVGINEISDQKRTLEWDGQDTKLARLLSLAKKFDAEIDFDTYLNADSSIKAFKVNVYHENDDNHQGVGRVRNDIQLTYGKNLKSIKRKIDKTGVYNAIRPTGKRTVKNGKGEEVEEIVTIGSLGAWSENNKDGVREFYQQGDMLYAPLSMQMYPSTFTSSTTNDQWIRKDMEVDSDSPSVIRASAIANLRKNAYPALTYEVDGFIDVEIGDTIRIYDDGFTPILLVQARVSHQKISFTNPASNQTTFANFKALENNLSDGIQAAFERLFEASKPYLIKLSTDNGVIFKNQIGQSLVTPSLYRGGKPVVSGVTWRWSLDGNITTGMTYLVQGSSVTDTATLTVAAYIGNDEVAVDELTFVNVLDGRDGGVGPKGDPGNDGVAGRDGNKVYTSIYEMSANQSGIYLSDLTPIANPANLPPIGSIVIAPSGKMYPIIALNPTSTPPSYTAGALVGNIKGPQGDNGQTPVVHWAYSDNADGTGLTTSDNGQRYIGHYSDYTQADSTDKTKYRWADRWAKIEVGGRNYLRNSSFVDGVSYWQNNSGAEQFSWRSVPEFATQLGRKGCVHLYSNGLPLDALGIFQVIQDMQLSEQEKITLSFDVVGREGNDSGLMVIINNHLFDVRQIIPVSSIRTYSQFTKTSLERKALTFTIPKACDAINVIIIFHGGITGDVVLTDFMLERGLVATSHQESPSDIADRIGVKADQALTQEQLNLLNERAQILDAELKAKASMDALSDLEKAYQSFVKSNADSRAKAEADLAEAGRRIELLVTQFGGFKELKTFIDTYMSSSNEGLIIGKNDASSTIKVSSDRISMFSAGKEVMYISQGVIHIDNGIFTASVQIGRFRTEQYHLNADMNVVRYVY
ncbi:phage tail spike protein [Streptococcus suis]|uniref:phage tail spike protein n=1 Tax=Streptococcus suis TaxID=1307 RepID=UPI00040FC0E6|nr:phage tail spike protein [Streptococcus suis]HEM3171403.1 phage tail protein [Streptococcus suis]